MSRQQTLTTRDIRGYVLGEEWIVEGMSESINSLCAEAVTRYMIREGQLTADTQQFWLGKLDHRATANDWLCGLSPYELEVAAVDIVSTEDLS